MESHQEGEIESRRQREPRRAIAWMEWSWRLFIATWPGVFILCVTYTVWVTTNIFRHEQRILALETGVAKDIEKVRMQTASDVQRVKVEVLSDIETRTTVRFDAVLTEIRELQRTVLTLKVRDDIERELRRTAEAKAAERGAEEWDRAAVPK